MSANSTVLTDAHFRYLAERTPGDDAFLRELKRAAEDAGIPSIWISPEQGSFMQILLKLAHAKDVVEVGTLAGYSAITMARALPAGGTVRTIELETKHADFAEQWVAKSDVADRVKVLRGAGADVLPTIPSDSADAAFVDADKSSYPVYVEECLRIVRRGGLVMVDNAFAFGYLLDSTCHDPNVLAVRQFNDRLAAEKRLHAIIAPIGDGCWVGVKT